LVTITARFRRIASAFDPVTTAVSPIASALDPIAASFGPIASAVGTVTADTGRIAPAYRTITGSVGTIPTRAALPARLIPAATITARGAAPVARSVPLLVTPRPTAP